MKKLWIALIAPPAIVLFVWLFGELVMHLWNWLLPPLFGWHLISFWQALGLLLLSTLGQQVWARWALAIKNQELNKTNGDLTVAIADEGICQLTDYRTPDPFSYFTRWHQLGVSTHDTYLTLMPDSELR